MDTGSLAGAAVLITVWSLDGAGRIGAPDDAGAALHGLHAIRAFTETIAAADPAAVRALETLAGAPGSDEAQADLRERLVVLLREEASFQIMLADRILSVAERVDDGGAVRFVVPHPADPRRPLCVIAPAPADRVLAQLTPPPARLVGRHTEAERALRLLLPLGDRPVAVTLTGHDGVGRTALARLLADRLHDRGTTGLQLEVRFPASGEKPATPDVDGTDPLLTVLRELLTGLGVPARSLPGDLAGCAALLESELAGRRPLLLVERAPGTTELTARLPPGCLVIVTSEPAVRDHDNEIPVPPLSPDESAALLFTRPPASQTELLAVRQIAAICSGLPLALSILGRHLADLSGAEIADLRNRFARAVTRRPESSSKRMVFAALELCRPPRETLQHRILLAAALLQAPRQDLRLLSAACAAPVDSIRPAIHDLVRRGLLEPYGRGGDRWRLHPMVAAYFRDPVTLSAAERAAIVERALRVYLARIRALRDLLDTAAVRRDPAIAAWAEAQLADDLPGMLRVLKLWAPSLSRSGRVLVRGLISRLGRPHDAAGWTEPAGEAGEPAPPDRGEARRIPRATPSDRSEETTGELPGESASEPSFAVAGKSPGERSGEVTGDSSPAEHGENPAETPEAAPLPPVPDTHGADAHRPDAPFPDPAEPSAEPPVEPGETTAEPGEPSTEPPGETTAEPGEPPAEPGEPSAEPHGDGGAGWSGEAPGEGGVRRPGGGSAGREAPRSPVHAAIARVRSGDDAPGPGGPTLFGTAGAEAGR